MKMCLGCDLWKSEFLTCFSFYVFVFVYIFFFINSDAYVFLDLRFRLFWAGWTVSFDLCSSSWWFCRYGWQMIMICDQNSVYDTHLVYTCIEEKIGNITIFPMCVQTISIEIVHLPYANHMFFSYRFQNTSFDYVPSWPIASWPM